MKKFNDNLVSDNQNEEIDLKGLFKVFLRNKKFIITLTGAFTIVSIASSYFMKHVYSGSFDIVVNTFNLGNINDNNLISRIDPFQSGKKNLKTEAFILKSPSVLMPVFDYVKNNDANLPKNIDYKTWLNSNFEINFLKGTEVLSINYKHPDKKFIIEILDKVSQKYKEYSKRDRERKLTNTINFLEDQKKLYKEKSRISRKNLNLFTIENGLGDLDGFVDLGKSNTKFNLESDAQQVNLKQEFLGRSLSSAQNEKSKAGQRYKQQFIILEKYEADYVTLSTNLKPNSKTLKNLKNKIENLKSSLKRPNEILLEFEELKKIAQRDEQLLRGIEDKYAMTKLEKVKQMDPWNMISKPTINRRKIKPKRSRIAIISFLLGLITTYYYSYNKERKTGIIFEFNELAEKIDCPYLETIFSDKFELSKKLIKGILKQYEEFEVGFIEAKNIEIDETKIKSNNTLDFYRDLILVNLYDEANLNKYNKLIIIAEEETFNKDQINLLNQFIKIQKEKFIGFIYLKKFKSS